MGVWSQVPVLVSPRTDIEVAVMVPADDDLVRMRKGEEPIDGGLDLVDGTVVGQIAGVDEQVTIGNVSELERVGVGDTDDTDRVGVRGWKAGRPTEAEE